MNIAPVVQGTPEWLQLRSNVDGTASEAPAVLGVSKYQTRAALMHQRHCGVTADVDERTQSLFDRGHAAEKAALVMAEELAGSELYPVTATERIGELDLLASLDGMTLEGDVIFEHKLWSEGLAAAVRENRLKAHYTVQMDQQLLVTGAEKCLFMVSDGTPNKMEHCWYTSTPEKAKALVAAWRQFHADLADYVPTEAAQIVTAAPVASLPAVAVRMDGALMVQSNLPAFSAALRAYIERIPVKPSTDQEFSDTEAACKSLKKAEEALEAAESGALASMADVEAMRRAVADCITLARTTRLASEKMVKARKEQIREDEVRRGRAAFDVHVTSLNARLGGRYMPLVVAHFNEAIRGLKTLDSVRNAIDTELARVKIEASATADRIEFNLKTLDAAGAPTLFADRAQLVLKDTDDLVAIIAQRLAAEHNRQNAERERIRAEEQAKAEASARAELVRQKEIEAAQQRADAAGRSADLGTAETPAPSQRETAPHAQESGFSPGTPGVYASNEAQAAQASTSGAGTAAHAGERAANPPSEPATLNLGAINDWLSPLRIDAAGLAELGIVHSGTAKAAKLYRESDKARIKSALGAHIQQLGAAAPGARLGDDVYRLDVS